MTGGPRRRILVVGAGFAGMYAAMGLKPAAADGHRVIVVNPENFMQYQPFLPEVASGTIDPRAVVVPLRGALRHCELVVGEVTEIDHEARRAGVVFADGTMREVDYDLLVFAPGSRSRVPPIPGLAEHGIGFKTVQEAIYLRNRVLSRLDVAAESDDPDAITRALTFVFVGAGYAGVEALGELEDLARDAVRNYPGLRRDRMRWILLDVAPAILPELEPDLARYAQDQLEDRGIEVLVSTKLERVEAGGVVHLSDGKVFATDTLVWTAGVKPPPLARVSGLPVDEAGRVIVDETFRVRGVTDAWAAGDAASVPDRTTGKPSPPTAQHALRQGKRLAANVVAELEGRAAEAFVHRNIGGVCSLGRYKGVAQIRGLRFRGFVGWFLHRSYHLLAMPTIGRRVRIALDWTIALFFPRDIAQLGSLEHPRVPFERAAGE